MSSLTLTPTSSIEANIKQGGRSNTLVKMILTNRWATVYAAAFLPLIVSAVLVLITFAWMKANNWAPDVFYSFFKSSLIMPAIVLLALGLRMYSFIASSSKLIMGMGFTRRDIWWAVLKVAAINALISTVVISIFSAIEIVTRGYGVSWYVLSMNLDEYKFYLHGLGYGPFAATVESARFVSHYFLILFTVQLAAALVAVVRLRWGLTISATVLLVIALVALTYFRSAFGTISWDLGLSSLYHPYHEVYFEGKEVSLVLNRGPWPIEDIQKSVDEKTLYMLPVKFIALRVVISAAKILAFSAVLFAAGATVLKKTDMR